MEIITSLRNIKPIKESVITVGNYDGIHLGHQDVINYIVEFGNKHNIPSCVITFDPNPYYILRNENKPINKTIIFFNIVLLNIFFMFWLYIRY